MSATTRPPARISRVFSPAVVFAVVAVVLVPVHAGAVLKGYDAVTEYAGSSLGSPFGIVTGPDGNIWYVASTNNFPTGGQSAAVVKVDPATGSKLASYSVSSSCTGGQIAIGPDQNLWIMGACYIPGDFVYSKLFRITLAGTVTTFDLPLPNFQFGGPGFFVAGPNEYDATGNLEKNVWFAEPDRTAIARLNPSTGAVTEFALPSGGHPMGIALGSDHNFWFTEPSQNRVGRISISGSITEYPLPTANSRPFDIVIGPDGNLYFAENLAQVGRITTGGVITEFTVPAPPARIKVGPDANLWFSESTVNKIASMTPSGVVHEVTVPTATSGVRDITTGPDGNLWFTETTANKIAQLGTRHNALVVDKAAVGFGSVPMATTPPTQRVTLANGGPDSLTAFTPTVSTSGGASGAFALAGDTCHLGAIAAGSSCYADVGFSPTALGTEAFGSLAFKTDSGLTTEQTLTVGLAATVVADTCKFTAISTDVPSPQSVGSTVTVSATSTGCPHASPLYAFSIKSPASSFTTVQGFGPATTFAWNTAAYTSGTYLIRVWAKDFNSSTASYDAFDTRSFTLLAPGCSAANLAPDVPSPQPVATTITFTATSIGCPSPQYQWWVRDSAGTWSIAPGRDFAHSSNTFSWNTTALTEGTYQIGFWAKELGSRSPYDAYAIVTYTLTTVGSLHCTSAGLTTDLATPRPALSTTTITLTGAATSCSAPLFRFWVRDLAGVWHIVQDYGTTATYHWNSSSTPVATTQAGTFLLGVWVKQPGSSASYDAFFISTFTLEVSGGAQCSVDLTPDKLSPQPLGTAVNWTAMTNYCTTWQMQFWIQPPGGAWAIAQPYGSSRYFSWSGSRAGTYEIGVWLLQTGSSAVFDNFSITTFTLQSISPTPTCGSAGVSANVPSPQALGTTVTFTATAAGCSSPLYQWWIRDTSASWGIAKDFAHSSTTLAWNTTGLQPGTYLVGVWARQSGSTSSYEAYSFFTYSLSGPAPQVCSSVAISTDVASPQDVGTNITVTASAVGCGAPTFSFFLAAPGNGLSLVQSYGVSNQYAWRMAGESYDSVGGLEYFPGAWQVGVWARQSGSTVSYESYGIITFDLKPFGGTCTTLAVWPSHSAATNTIDSQSPQPVGTTITWRPAVTGCSPANYQFYVMGAAWPTFVDHSYDSTLVWNTAGLPAGTYQLSVLVFSFADQVGIRVLATFEIV